MAPRGGRSRDSDRGPESQDASQISSEALEPALPFFNTTFSPYRVSPLYVGAEPLDESRFSALAKRLRDLLVGDVVRGVEVGLDGDDGLMARAGALEAVDFGWSSLGSILGLTPDMVGDDDAVEATSPSQRSQRLEDASDRQALHISIRYESALCMALLLPQLETDDTPNTGEGLAPEVDGLGLFQRRSGSDSDSDSDRPVDPDHFRNLPLLLVRMPAPLRSVVVDFLSSTFDCRISPLRLGTRTLLTNLERWIAASKSMRGAAVSKDVVITLGFSLSIPPTPDAHTGEARTTDAGLKSIDVIIPASDLQRFRDEGGRRKTADAAMSSKRKRTSTEGEVLLEEGWGWRHEGGGGGTASSCPFTEALGSYFDEHMALNLFDSRTSITKIACGGFVMSESRLKLFSASGRDAAGEAEHPVTMSHMRAVVDCLGDLLDRAAARI